MRRLVGAVLAAVVASLLSGCAGSIGGAFPVEVAIQGAFKSAMVGGAPIQVTAVLTNDVATASGVTWALTAGGSSCSPACGTLTAGAFPGLSATYTPPTSDPSGGNLNPTITATSVNKTSKNASFSFQLLTKAVVSYVFVLRGFDNVGSPMAMAGNIAVDSVGNVRGGELDVNDGHQVTSIALAGALPGNYTINSGSGAATRGTINLPNLSLFGTTATLSFKFVNSSDQTNGTMIELDSTGYFNAGTFERQDPTALTGSVPSGSFAFGLDSDDPLGSRTVEAGQINPSGGTGLADQSQAGAANPIYSDAAVTVSAGAPDALGRGTLGLTVNGGSAQYAYYIVDANRMGLIELDTGPTVQSGSAHLQSALTAASVNMSSVLQLAGANQTATNATAPVAVIGSLAISGNSSLSVLFDSNNIGTVLSKVNVTGSVASFDPTTGRGVLSVTSGFTSGLMNSGVFYLYDSGDGYMIDADTTGGGVTNYALSGTLINRTGSSFSNLTLSGNALLGFGGSPTRDVPNVTAAINFGSASFSGTGSLTSFLKSGGPYTDASFINATDQVTDTTNGYGTAVVPASLFGNFTSNTTATASFYLIDTNRAVMIGTQSGTYSGVLFYIPF